MKTPIRELRLHLGLVELVKAPQRLREATVVAFRHYDIMECSRGLRGALVVARGATMVASRKVSGNSSNNERSCRNQWIYPL